MRKKLFCCLLILGLCAGAYPLTRLSGSVTVEYEYGSQNVELRDLFRFKDIDYYRFKFSCDSINNYVFEISCTEYVDGRSSGEEPLVPIETMKTLMTLNDTDSFFRFNVISQQLPDDQAKFMFVFIDRMGQNRLFKIYQQDPSYSLRIPFKSGDQIAVGKKIPFLVYSLPYEDPNNKGYYRYCQLTADGIPPEKWGEHYGVKHYIIFYLQIMSGSN